MSSQKNYKSNKSLTSLRSLILCVSFITLFFLPEMADPFNTIKLVLLLIVGGWFSGHLISSYQRKPIAFRSADSVNFLISFFFLLALLVSTLLTDIKIIGFIGDTQRRNGFLAYFCLTVIFLYASRIANFQSILIFFKIVIITTLVLSAYGILQISGNDFVSWSNPYNRMISTLGNPNFASALLAVFSVILIFGLYLESLSKIYKMISIIVILMSIFAIIASESRQGILVLLFSSLFYLVIYVHKNKIKFSTSINLLSFLAFTFSVAGMLQKGPLTSLLYKDSVSVRGYYWRAGWEMFKANFFSGVGVDRYGAHFKEYREPGYALKYGFEIGSSNAHNVIIQLFSTAGILVGSLYLILLSYILISGLKLVYKTSGQEQKIILTLLAAWIGFVSQSFISIDNIGISVWGWLLGGLISGLNLNSKQDDWGIKKVDFSNKNPKVVQINLIQPIFSILFLIPLTFVSVYLMKFETDLYKVRAITLTKAPENNTHGLHFASKILNNPLGDPNYKFEAAMSLLDLGYVKEGSEAFEALYKNDPDNLFYLNLIARNEAKLGRINLAINAREKISILDPWNAENYLSLCELYLQSNNLPRASQIKDKIWSFAPNSAQAKMVSNLFKNS